MSMPGQELKLYFHRHVYNCISQESDRIDGECGSDDADELKAQSHIFQ